MRTNPLQPRWTKVWSDLWGDRRRTGLVVASIAVGMFAVGVIVAAYAILAHDVNRGFAAVNPPNIELSTDSFSSDLVDAVEHVPGVGQAEGRRILSVRARRQTEAWQDLRLVGSADTSGAVNRLVPIAGVLGLEKDQALVSKELLHDTGFKVGDTLEVELPDRSTHRLTVVGIVTDQTASKPDPGSTNNLYVNAATLRSLGLDGSFNHLYVTVAGPGDDAGTVDSVAVAVKKQVEDSGRQVYRLDERLSSEHPMIHTLLAMLGVLGALGALVAVLSSSLTINTLGALLAEQRRQIGVMKLVGARAHQILGMYLALILAYGVIALVIALPLAAIGGYVFAWGIASLLGAVVGGFRIVPSAILAQVLIGLLLPLGAGFFPVRSGARIHVRQAINSSRAAIQAASNRMLRLNARGLRWIPRPILLSFRNTFRKRGRLLLTVFTLSMSGAVFIAVFNVRDSMRYVVGQSMQHFMGDVRVEFSRPYRVEKIRQTLLGIPGVTAVEGWGGASGEIWDANDNVVSNLNISAPPQDTRLLRPDFVAGRWLRPGEKNAVVVSDKIYQYFPKIHVGDTIIVKLPGEHARPWAIVGIFRLMSLNEDPLAYGTFDFISAETHLHGEAASYRVITDVHDPASQQTLARRIDGDLTRRDFAVQNVEAGAQQQAKAAQGIDVLILFLLIMAILTASVGSIGLTGTMSINVMERTREIGVMRAIGAVDRVVMQSVIIEGVVVGLITWVLAIVASFPISYFLLGIIGDAIAGSEIALRFTPFGMLFWLGIVVILSILASIAPARNASRLTIREVLAYE
jgi:putative ABC transport system permease protein